VSGAQAPVRWGIVGLGWVAADFVAPAMVKSSGSRLATCLGSSLDKGRVCAERFGVERVHGDLEGSDDVLCIKRNPWFSPLEPLSGRP
jgi:predicted dehydrogenase